MSEQEKYNKIIDAIRTKASEILPKGSQIALYGSRARGDNRMDSDWDIHILIPGDEKLPFSLWDTIAHQLEAIGWDFDELITARVYSFSGWLKRSFLPFYKNVEHDKIIIFRN
ncbi:MAG: nucleotidyltransferase domain-containing protein [Muribaculaceae bacterium]|nr:nucleotidyltransferase domain-containing protein [Muribaculaceae bacterium]